MISCIFLQWNAEKDLTDHLWNADTKPEYGSKIITDRFLASKLIH